MSDSRTDFSVSFAQESLAPPVESVSGLGRFEGWGRWNSDNRITIRLDRDLPSAFEVRIACAIAPANVGRVIILLAGRCVRRLVCTHLVANGLETAKIRFHPGEPARCLDILIPDVERGSRVDPRPLGFALGALAVTSLDAGPGRTRAHG